VLQGSRGWWCLATWVLTCCTRAAPGLGWLHLGLSLAPCTAGVGETGGLTGPDYMALLVATHRGPGSPGTMLISTAVSALWRSPLGAVVLGVLTPPPPDAWWSICRGAPPAELWPPPGDVFGSEAHHVCTLCGVIRVAAASQPGSMCALGVL
jgi:hypothetical protein